MTPRNRTEQVKQSRAGEEPLPTTCIDLSQAQATRWLAHLERMLVSAGDASPSLEQLRDRLEDGCWLARWKREEVILELCPTTLLGVLDGLLQISQTDQPVEDITVLEEIVEVLSRANTGAVKRMECESPTRWDDAGKSTT